MTTLQIGVLALQGDYEAHCKMLARLEGVEPALVRNRSELEQVDGLILPGGESTTIGKLLVRMDLLDPLRQRALEGMPVYGTCAGMILMATRIQGSDQPRLSILDMTVARNAFGRQIESFEADIEMPAMGAEPVRGVFIRAPYVTETGEGVETLARYRDVIVAVRKGVFLATAFHPELTDDDRVHAAFVRMCRRRGQPDEKA